MLTEMKCAIFSLRRLYLDFYKQTLFTFHNRSRFTYDYTKRILLIILYDHNSDNT